MVDRGAARYHESMRKIKDRWMEKGVIGYAFLWWLGVPATLLFIIFLLRGCN